jgi:hypothetical protein
MMSIVHWTKLTLRGFGLALLTACATEVGPKVTPPGEAKSAKTSAMEQGARALQTQDPVRQLAVYLVGFHADKDDPSRQMTAHHFCRPVNQDLTQCALFDGNSAEANLTGVEYIISEKLFNELPQEEQPYWHPHNFEILSGTLTAPGLPAVAEHDLFAMFMNSYGKTWHTWQTGMYQSAQQHVPLGPPHLAWSFNHEGEAQAGLVESRDREMNISSSDLRNARKDLADLAHPQVGVEAISSKFPGPLRSISGVVPKEDHSEESGKRR